MNIVQLIALGLSVGPLVLAAAIRFLLMRNTAPLGSRVAVLTALAGSIPACGAVLGLFALWSPLMPLSFDLTFRAAVPLALGIVALPLLMIPGSRARTIGVATLSRRRMGRFVSRWWIWTLLALVVVVLILTIAAGSASRQDENGHYTMFWASMGTTEIGTGIYGWHFSTPSLVALAVLLVMLFATLQAIASRPWEGDIEADAVVRRLRSSNALRLSCGAVGLHLSVILQSLAGTASLRGQSMTTELGMVTVGTPFAALEPVLLWTGIAAFVIGQTACLLTAMTAIPTRRRTLATRS